MGTTLRKPGRPKNLAKREAVLEAATALFGQNPYSSVTMDAVAAAAGVSKMTAYSYFADKESLFEATVHRISEGMLVGLSAVAADGPIDERLNTVGRAFLSVVARAELSGSYAILIAELRRNRALARRFYEAGPGRTRAALSGLIEAGVAAGTLDAADPMQAADDLMALWVGSLPQRLAAGMEEVIDPDMLDRRTRHGTDVFLRAYARRDGASRPR